MHIIMLLSDWYWALVHFIAWVWVGNSPVDPEGFVRDVKVSKKIIQHSIYQLI